MQNTSHNKPAEFSVLCRTPLVELDCESLEQHPNLKEALLPVVGELKARHGNRKLRNPKHAATHRIGI